MKRRKEQKYGAVKSALNLLRTFLTNSGIAGSFPNSLFTFCVPSTFDNFIYLDSSNLAGSEFCVNFVLCLINGTTRI